jgi:uncharacterized protein
MGKLVVIENERYRHMTPNRRAFLTQAAAVSAAFAAIEFVDGGTPATAQAYRLPNDRYGPLISDPAGIMDLPRGFEYTIVSRTGDLMSDGFRTPGKPDGAAVFGGLGRDRVIMVRNHELGPNSNLGPFVGSSVPNGFDRTKAFDQGETGIMPGGTTNVIYNTRTRQVEKSFLSLVGTMVNCAGGPTPWGSWLSCEETVHLAADAKGQQDHGWVFEVPSSATRPVTPFALKDMGRFRHEAAAVDPRSGAVYQTEDEGDGLIYRFLPNAKGELAKGGRLQVLAIKGQPSADTRNWESNSFATRTRFDVEWLDITGTHNPDKDLRMRGRAAGAAIFARGEGMWFGAGEVYFACTSGGRAKQGQIWRYRPSRFEGQSDEVRTAGSLELFIENNDSIAMQNCDNICISPRGLLVITEDGGGDNYMRVADRDGRLNTLARNAMPGNSELAGCCFSPDGGTLFVSIQTPGVTLAIHGPFGVG